jgi:uncharacterized protein (TIGR02246 family)
MKLEQTMLNRTVSMRVVLTGTLAGMLLAGLAVHASAAPATATPAQEASANLEQMIQRESEATVKAFNNGDTAALVAMFLENGELVDEQGTVHTGTPAIKNLFTGFFGRYPKSTLELVITSVRPVGDMLAVEEGARRITTAEGDSAQVRYVTVRTKQGDRWPIASYREFSDDRTAISFRWSEDGNYLLGDYTMSAAGAGESKSTQRIGFDPVTGQLRSWTFDDDGGFTEGRWAATDRGWVIRSEATMPDGSTGSALLTVTVKGPDRFVIRGTERIVAGVEEPDFEVTITRKPPQPGTSK